MWAHKTWWDSESPAGLRKDGSWGKLLGAGPGCQIQGKLEGVQTWTSSQGGYALRGQSRVEATPGSCWGLSLAEGRGKAHPPFESTGLANATPWWP